MTKIPNETIRQLQSLLNKSELHLRDLKSQNDTGMSSSYSKAKARYKERRSRDSLFGNPDLFADPAWDILLDLYIAHYEKRDISVSSACIGAAVPPTTALRWLTHLTDQGIILRTSDESDMRRVFVTLSPTAIFSMDQFFENVRG